MIATKSLHSFIFGGGLHLNLSEYVIIRTRNPFELVYKKKERQFSQFSQGIRIGNWKVINGDSTIHLRVTSLYFVCLCHSPMFHLNMGSLSFSPSSTWFPSSHILASLWFNSKFPEEDDLLLGLLQVSASNQFRPGPVVTWSKHGCTGPAFQQDLGDPSRKGGETN